LNHPDPTHILPVLAAVATFIQLRMSQVKTTPGAPTDASMQSMKMMQYIMPVFILFLGWSYPAGLALYWTTSTIFQAVQQYFVTGWGSLLVKPDFQLAPAGAGGKAKTNGTVSARSYTNDRPKARRQVVVEEEPEDDDNVVESDPVSSQSSTDPRPSGTPYNRRRQRSTSASARRRSTQRSRS
jgi:YidC/Oxa1 family membrane protein insertase